MADRHWNIVPVIVSLVTVLAALAFSYGGLNTKVDLLMAGQQKQETLLTKLSDKLEEHLQVAHYVSKK
jgi:hypothetical protein